MATKRIRLSLKEKIEIIEVAEKEKLSIRALGERFKISKTQIGNLLKNKLGIKELWIKNSNGNSKIIKFRETDGQRIDSVVYDWFCCVRSKNIPVSGPLLQEKAREVSESLGVENFKASNGWLEKFKTRHILSFKTICGDSKSVDIQQASDWMERIEHVCEEYQMKNIFNLDETGLFFRAMPNKTMCLKGEKCSGGKVSKERLTVMLCCNMLGDFETPLVIGKAKKPRCFKNIDTNKLSVQWEYNKKAWMTLDIMSKWLIAFNAKMKKQKRKVLLFMDNAPSHPSTFRLQNIEIVFFPPNTTSVCQPLDQGIIQNFKQNYRTLLLRHVLSKAATSANNDALSKTLTILDSINWITVAVNNIKKDCVLKCFRKCGFSLKDNELISNNDTTANESSNNASANEYEEFIQLVSSTGSDSPIEDYLSIDSELYTEQSNNDLNLILDNFDTGKSDEERTSDEDNNEELLINDINDALKYTAELKKYFLNIGDNDGINLISKVSMHVEKKACNRKCLKQTNLSDFFSINNEV